MSVLDGPGEGSWAVFAEKVVEEREELLHKLAGQSAHIKSLEGLLVDALRERDALHGAMTVRYSLSREIEEIFGVTGAEASDEQLALGVAAARRIVRERDEAQAEVADLSNKYTESWKCSLDVPKDPCFDCIRCLRLRLKGRP
jgi:hypothetical protein